MPADHMRDQLIAAATEIHDRDGCTCDRKYLMSCQRMPAAILRAGKEMREATDTAPSTHHRACPTCGHHTSAWVGGACTVFVPTTDREVEAGAPLARYCGHDCSVDMLGESLHERFARTFREATDAR